VSFFSHPSWTARDSCIFVSEQRSGNSGESLASVNESEVETLERHFLPRLYYVNLELANFREFA